MDSTDVALLRIGPGPRLDRVAVLIEALGRVSPGAPGLSRWSDVAELLLAGPRDRIVLDADHFPLEDIGILRRFLVARPAGVLEAIGSERTRAEGRALLALERSRWHPWPMDLAQLEALLRGPAPAFLAGERALDTLPTAQGNSNERERHELDLRAPLGDLAAGVRRTSDAWLKLRSSGGVDPASGDSLGGEIVRLERAMRSLHLGADRSPRSPEELDLDALVEEELAVFALQARRAARVRYQGGEVLMVRADRATLVHALTALLEIVRALVPGAESVEVKALRSTGEQDRFGPARAIVRLRAPAGVLAELSPGQLFLPGGLADRLPGIGPNELHVLARLCTARGLSLEARSVPGAPIQLEIDLSAPLVVQSSALLAETANLQ